MNIRQIANDGPQSMVNRSLSTSGGQGDAVERCILCAHGHIRFIANIPVEMIVSGWRQTFDIDVRAELGALDHISLYSCANCGLKFFHPPAAGSELFYSRLQKNDWYYMPDKWEFSQALQDIPASARLLEVGSGSGSFIRKAIAGGLQAEGIELNDGAVQLARQQDLPVARANLFDLAASSPAAYDAVCCFQVLEHIPEPNRFLEACAALLKSGGCLAVSIPNEDSFIRYDREDLLNKPPHHITHWSRRVLEFLPRLFPLRLVRIEFEPLAPYHLDWYASVQRNRLSGDSRLGRLAQRSYNIIFNSLIKPTGLYRLVRGHTVYACYRKF